MKCRWTGGGNPGEQGVGGVYEASKKMAEGARGTFKVAGTGDIQEFVMPGVIFSQTSIDGV